VSDGEEDLEKLAIRRSRRVVGDLDRFGVTGFAAADEFILGGGGRASRVARGAVLTPWTCRRRLGFPRNTAGEDSGLVSPASAGRRRRGRVEERRRRRGRGSRLGCGQGCGGGEDGELTEEGVLGFGIQSGLELRIWILGWEESCKPLVPMNPESKNSFFRKLTVFAAPQP